MISSLIRLDHITSVGLLLLTWGSYSVHCRNIRAHGAAGGAIEDKGHQYTIVHKSHLPYAQWVFATR